MRQEEFLMNFQNALTGEVSDRIIQDNINYYRRYINHKMQEGMAEEEILRSLGSPRLLAKTIIESSKFAEEEQYESFTDQRGWGSSFNESEYTGQTVYQEVEPEHKAIHIPGWIMAIIGIIAMTLLIGLAFCVISYLVPVIVFFGCIILVCRLVRKVVRGY